MQLCAFAIGQAIYGRVAVDGLAAQRLQWFGSGGVVRVRMGADNCNYIARYRIVQALNVFSIVWAWVDDDVACVSCANNVAVGARSCHHTGVGRGQSAYKGRQLNGFKVLPIGLGEQGSGCIKVRHVVHGNIIDQVTID